ncbi:MAG: bifunctional UDP-3-O-[3-hydroxymyristoyl] N-acetylglucosamine deacetylase/3-hydroxyacyl-ACP dehydratase [Saprospiraceae bacterium]|nr:bifunctional UDP-3-O-[3-hydroxymyristoyl] N-acetylglucosamine deacetylase/3-hydroxyacyl-ACP dehydratase [Saprospiraceae bacterium]
MKQRTIINPVSLHGVGLHSGKEVTMTFKPAPANHGIKFQRVDLADAPVLLADVSKVVSTNRGTTIKQGNAQVSTVEHALSALLGMSIDNVLIEIDGPEVPIMDGSAQPFVEKLQEAGLEELDEDREYFEIMEPISYVDEVTGTELLALPSKHFEVTALIDFNSPILGHQYASLKGINNFVEEIAPCRTFVFLRELDQLLSQNLIKGGDLANAIVIVDRLMDHEELEKLARKLNKNSVKVEKEGILNTTDLHFENEPARHKLLDIVGDLALIGRQIKGKIVATKPGHTANIEFAKVLKRKYIEQRKLRGKPKIDPDQAPIYDVIGIKRLLPHRYPFLLVDKVVELSDSHVVGVKNVTFNEAFFQGHFPNNPVFPGVLQMEALAQVGGVFVLSQVPDPENWDTYFIKIEHAKFKAKVVPGDTLILKMELLSPVRRGICHMFGTAYVGNRIVSEGELTAQIIKREEDEHRPSKG